MDNTQDVTTAAPQGQAPTTTPVPGDTGALSTGSVAGAATDQGQPEGLILGKFKSVEALTDAYKNLESHSKQVEMARAELEKTFEVQSQTAPALEQPSSDGSDPIQSLMQELAPKFRGEFEKMLSPVVAKMEIDDAVRRYGDDFVQNASKIKELKAQKPYLSLDDAYKQVAFDTIRQGATSEGMAKAQKIQEDTKKAIVESSTPSGIPSPSLDDAMADKSIPFAELLEAMGPEYKKAYAKNLRK